MAEAPAASRDEIELFVEGVLALAGPGRVLVCGPGGEAAAHAFNLRGVGARHQLQVPRDSAAHDVLVLWHALDALSPSEGTETLARLRPFAGRVLVLRADGRAHPERGVEARWFETGAIEAGYRKHPLYLQLWPYESRELDTRADVLALEPVPEALLQAHPLEWLARERDLHMDMLREAGRRSDAHVERYRLAIQFVRPGDVVLDVACGLGYGSRALYEGTGAAHVLGVDESETAIAYASAHYGRKGRIAFRAGDAQRLDFVPDASVDLLVTFETLEHLHEPGRLLDEALRVLRPAGRIVACVPNLWVDEHGNDPNPHHHQVYDWARLRGEFAQRFRVERAFRQIAGGGMTHTGAARLMHEFDPEAGPGETEWLIIVAMKDPVAGREVPYVETTFTGYDKLKGFHVARFADAYDNPWLVKGMVSIGFRFEAARGLLDMAREVAAVAPAGSPDHGAALCVEAYALIGTGPAEAAARAALKPRLLEYVESGGRRPHQLRWRISNLFALALLELVDGRLEAARALFERCAAMDPMPFSPLLATKTIGAAYNAGLLAALAGDAGDARRAWAHGIGCAKALFAADWKNVIGRDDHPVPFGLQEVTHALDKASKCASAIDALPELAERPGRFWALVSRDIGTYSPLELRRLRSTLDRERAERQAAVARISESHAWSEGQRQEWARAAQAATQQFKEASEWSQELQAAKDWLEGELEREKRGRAEEAGALREAHQWAESERVKWEAAYRDAEANAKRWEAAFREAEAHLDRWEAAYQELQASARRWEDAFRGLSHEREPLEAALREAHAWAESQRAGWEQAARERGEALEAARAWAAKLEGDAARREDEWQQESQGLRHELETLRREVDALRDAHAWAEAQRQKWEAAARDAIATFDDLRTGTQQLLEGKRWLEEALGRERAAREADAAAAQARLASLQEDLGKAHAETDAEARRLSALLDQRLVRFARAINLVRGFGDKKK